MTIGEYVHNRSMHFSTLYRIINGIGYYVHGGNLYTDKEFEKIFPVTIKPQRKINYPGKGEDKGDKRHNWLEGEKSY